MTRLIHERVGSRRVGGGFATGSRRGFRLRPDLFVSFTKFTSTIPSFTIFASLLRLSFMPALATASNRMLDSTLVGGVDEWWGCVAGV